MTTAGRGRPPVRRLGIAGWIARQLARMRASGATSGPCTTVDRTACAWKELDGRRPSRRSLTRVEGRTKWAAGRAAYLAAML
jgi:hypothetical protein